MGKIVLVSNRLSTSVTQTEDGFSYSQSMGGLATGLSSLHQQEESLWVGWSGIPREDLSDEGAKEIETTLRQEYKSVAIHLSGEEIEAFYLRFCNNTVWPLFHYFPTYTEYDNYTWETYRRINERFHEAVVAVAEEDDTIWVHDYHLMMLPAMLRKSLPQARIGFFLHIPFPSYEIFRLLPWRQALLEGMLGADLIGFHTYDYARHFLSATRRIVGAEHDLGNIKHDNRIIRVDAFPMGIDYQKYAESTDLPEVQTYLEKLNEEVGDRRLMLSVDRLDYTKGIPLRIRAYHQFLDNHPEYREKVVLVLIAAPSRTEVPQYAELKREIDELVSTTNGEFGTLGWNPIWYYFRPAPFEHLSAFYAKAEVLLVTPLRDGMNLISKEYIAARRDRLGVVVLSETAGSSRELAETLIVNPNNIEGIAAAIHEALNLSEETQRERNERLHKRLARYDIHYWARDFIDKLHNVADSLEGLRMKKLTAAPKRDIAEHFAAASSRLLFIDFDGTLTDSGEVGGLLDDDTREALRRLAEHPETDVVIVSGRQRDDLERRFANMKVNIIAGHGIWRRDREGQWHLEEAVSKEWKDVIRPMLDLFQDRTPGSRVEEHEFSLLWYFDKAQPELAAIRLNELRDALLDLTANHEISILESSRYLEIKSATASKGRAASHWYHLKEWDFVMALGDDWTDEDIFAMLDEKAYSVKVGVDISSAKYFLDSVQDVRLLVRELSDKAY